VEEYSLVNDNMGDKERHGSLKTYDIESSKEREMQPTHHKESSMFNETYKGNVFKLPVKEDEDNAVDVDVAGAVATLVDDNLDRPNNCNKLEQRFGPDDYSPKEDGQDDHIPSNYSPDDSDLSQMKSKPRTNTRRRRARGSMRGTQSPRGEPGGHS
jgi:hypothetical protein